jgi:ankyrin repeat protein
MAALPDEPPPFPPPLRAAAPAQRTDLDFCWKRGWRGTPEALAALMSPNTITAEARPPAHGWRASQRLCRLASPPTHAANADSTDNADDTKPRLGESPRRRSRGSSGNDADDADAEFVAAVRACWWGDAAAATAYMRKLRRVGLAGSVRRIPTALLGQLQEAGEIRSDVMERTGAKVEDTLPEPAAAAAAPEATAGVEAAPPAAEAELVGVAGHIAAEEGGQTQEAAIDQEAAAATKIQALRRGKRDRAELQQQKDAAVKIQAVQRGKHARADVAQWQESTESEADDFAASEAETGDGVDASPRGEPEVSSAAVAEPQPELEVDKLTALEAEPQPESEPEQHYLLEAQSQPLPGGGVDSEEPPSECSSVVYFSWEGSTPLHVAAARGHAAVCEALLEGGHPVDAVSSDGYTPLLCALLSTSTAPAGLQRPIGDSGSASVMRHELAVEVLLRCGADPDCLWAPCTPLQVAAAAGLASSLSQLLEAGAAPGGRWGSHELGEKDAAPLSIALHCGHVDCAELLRKHGADQRQWWGRHLAQPSNERASAQNDGETTKAAATATMRKRPGSSPAAVSPYAASPARSSRSSLGLRLSKNAPKLSRHPRVPSQVARPSYTASYYIPAV